MKKLDILFRGDAISQIQALVDDIGFDKSKVARAALNLGLKTMREARRQQAINIVGADMCRQVIKGE